jgi:hypothetical protein
MRFSFDAPMTAVPLPALTPPSLLEQPLPLLFPPSLENPASFGVAVGTDAAALEIAVTSKVAAPTAWVTVSPSSSSTVDPGDGAATGSCRLQTCRTYAIVFT